MCCVLIEYKYKSTFDGDVAGKLKLEHLTECGDVNTHSNSHSVINKCSHQSRELIREGTTLCSSVALESIMLIKAPHFLSDDPILNNEHRLRREEAKRFWCLDMQLCESCSSEGKKLEPPCQI